MWIPDPLTLPPGVPEYPLEFSFRQSEWHQAGLCEWPELYMDGGLYPMTLGTLIQTSSNHKGWYRIIRKLGFGWDWTTWLAQHEGVQLKQPQYLVVQIMSESRGIITSIVSLSRDLRASHDDLDPMHVNSPEGYALRGPNGSHACLTYPHDYLPLWASPHPLTSHPPLGEHVPRFPTRIIKSILKQTLLGIESIHKAGWIHGAIGLHSLEVKAGSYPQDVLQGPEDQTVLEKIRHTPDEAYAPLYLTRVRPILPTRDDRGENIRIKLGNLGFAFPSSQSVYRWKAIAGPYEFRAPEMVYPLEDEISEWSSAGGADIWAFGCLVYRLYTGHHLIPEIPVTKENPDIAIYTYWLYVARTLGRLPNKVIQTWPELSILSELP